MQALISPNESVYTKDGQRLGARVAEVEPESFPVAEPLFWVPCAPDVIASQSYWDGQQIQPIPVPPPPPVSVPT